jgi:hypothetical protein
MTLLFYEIQKRYLILQHRVVGKPMIIYKEVFKKKKSKEIGKELNYSRAVVILFQDCGKEKTLIR